MLDTMNAEAKEPLFNGVADEFECDQVHHLKGMQILALLFGFMQMPLRFLA